MIAPPPAQLSLNLHDARWRPVVAVNGTMAALDLNALEVDELIDLGFLIAFNIAVDPDGRRELRILTRSISQYQASGRKFRMELPALLKLLTPHSKPTITGLEIQRSLNCDCEHVTNLLRANQIAVAPGTNWQRGPGGSPCVTSASYETFLRTRIIGDWIGEENSKHKTP